jgi:diguanylate cyclase (GGDEF)-like protein
MLASKSSKRPQVINRKHNRLRFLYAALCVLQLSIMGADLALAHRLERSYSAQLSYETTLNEHQHGVDQLRALADAGAPAGLDASQDDWTAGVERVRYSSTLFVARTQQLLSQVECSHDIAFSRCADDLRALLAESQAMVTQVRRADEARRAGNIPVFNAAAMAADRNLSRLHTILGNISENISNAKNDMLALEAARVRHTRSYLIALTILGFLLVVPVTAYARNLSKQIAAFDAELQAERDALEQRVQQRTSQLRNEIAERIRLEEFNRSENRILEMVAEGALVANILSELALAVEAFCPSTRCVISSFAEQADALIAPSFPRREITALGLLLAEPAGAVQMAQRENRAVFLTSVEGKLTGVEASELATQYQFASWSSVPYGGRDGAIAGTISMLQCQSRLTGQDECDALMTAARMARMAVTHSQMHEELFHRAHHDPLTQLPNRALCDQRIDEAIARANRRLTSLAVLCIDLDEFKEINDQYGHEAGDCMLHAIAGRLSACVRSTDTLARLGGDEFMIVLEDVKHAESVEKFAEGLLKTIAEPVPVGDALLRTTASIGAALYPSDGNSASQLKVHADHAMYRAKELGRNTFQIFSPELSEKFARRHQLERLLREALEKGGFELHYQPQYTLERELNGLEALLRFRSPELQTISPAEFIPVAEQTGLIVQIGQWVLKEVCRQGCRWQESGFLPLPIAINVSALEFAQENFSQHVEETLRETGFDPACLQIEVTETAMMNSIEQVTCHLRKLSHLGVEVSIDDFGTGHSSLSYLHRLPIDSLKVDRSFVSQITESKESVAIVRAIIAMAGGLGLKIVAEGVETEEQLATLGHLGCKVVQGFLFSRPLPPEAVENVLPRRVHSQAASVSAVSQFTTTNGLLQAPAAQSKAPAIARPSSNSSRTRQLALTANLSTDPAI